jgi:hypothetical protein
MLCTLISLERSEQVPFESFSSLTIGGKIQSGASNYQVVLPDGV